MYLDDDKKKMIKSNEMAYLYLLTILEYFLTWLSSILWIYQKLDDSKEISIFLDTSWCIPAIHFFTFLTSKWYITVVQHEEVNMKQPKSSVIHGLEKAEQRKFLHQRYQFSDMDRYATAKLFWTFNYSIVLHCLNIIYHRQLSH